MSVSQFHECPKCKHVWCKDLNDISYGDYQGCCSKCGYPNMPLTSKEFYQSICLCMGCKACEYHNTCKQENNNA